MIGELSAAKRLLVELMRLDHRAHRAVEDHHALSQNLFEVVFPNRSSFAFFFFLVCCAGKLARATKISTGRLPLRAIFSPAKEPVKS